MTWEPYRYDNEAVEKERERFCRARKLIDEGREEEARRAFWWPRNESPPTSHWSLVPIHRCNCGAMTPSGYLNLCYYCSGVTPETPSLIESYRRE